MLQHLSQLGLQVNWENSKLSPVQSISFLGMELDSVKMMACLTNEHAQSGLNSLNAFRRKTAVPLKQFQRHLGHVSSAAVVMTIRLLHLRLLQHWLFSQVPRWAWHHGTLSMSITLICHQTFDSLSVLAFLHTGVPLEQNMPLCAKAGWDAMCDGHAASGSWAGPRVTRWSS